MNRTIPAILVIMVLLTGLVNAHSPHYSEKLRLDHKKNFSRVIGESGSGNVRYNRDFKPHKATTASGTLNNPYGNVTHYGYDGYDRISKVTDPLNNVTLIGRANTGNLLSLKQLDQAGAILLQSIRINDPAGRLKSYTIKMPNTDDDITYTRIYEDNGKRIIFKDPLERQTVIQLNDDGKVDTVTDAAGNMIKYYYEDGRGNATKKEETVKSADGTKTETYYTEYKYNAHNQVETITDLQTQAVTTFTYDLKGNLTGTIDAEGNTITYEYDELGRKIKTKQHFKDTSLKPVETTFEYYPVNTYNNQTHEGTYSPSNRLKSITDDKGNKTIYEYDNQNRVKKVIYPDNTYTEYTYDKTATGATNPSGNPTYYRLVIEKQRNDTVVKNYYDQLQRLMKREIIPAEGAAGTTIETFTYDELSRLKHAADDDTTLDYQFDRASRMDWENQAGKLIDYTYNKLSNLTNLTYPNTRLIEKEYDKLNRMNLIKEGTFTIADMTHIGRSYRLLRKQYGNGDLITYLYDQGRRLQDLEAKNLNNNSLINHYRYGYNKINLKTYEQRLHNADKGDVYGYDALYRLTNVKFNVPGSMLQNPTEFEREKSINHDNLHNTISIIESFNGQTRSIIPEIPDGTDYSKLNQVARFDQWGLEYDKNGNLKQKGTQRYTHDYRNQLISAVDGTLSVEMKYDVMGRRVQKDVNKGSQTEVRNYYYSGYQLIEERDGNDQVTRQYIYGNGIDEIIRMDKYQGTVVTSYYFHTDSIGSVTAITDSQGNLVERVTYDIYGMPTFWAPAGNQIPESLIGNTILFQGREYDPELNLYYYRARYYDPIMGRFLETDPMGYADSMNLYQGFNMNPANFLDPFGLLRKFIVADFQAVCGPSQSQEAGTYDQTPTKAGNFIIGTRPFVYSNPSARYVYSTIPWKTPIRVNQNREVQYKKGSNWITLKNRRGISYTEEEIQDDVNWVLEEIRDNQPTQNIPSSVSFPDKWILNDYGHSTVGYFYDANNNGIMDNREYLENDMIHPTPIGEMQKVLGIPNNQIYLEESHGCIHVAPDDMDTLCARGYLNMGTKVVVHLYSEDIPRNWQNDSTVTPSEVHIFPGAKKIVIVGEK